MSVDLFSMTVECGCAAKIPADWLARVLRNVDVPAGPDLVVGPKTLDDAGVYRISDSQCLVQTVDYFPPVARDPYTYGQIAAANSLSDVYAMGGEPLTALAIVCFPAGRLGVDVLEEMTRGAVDKLSEAGALLVGGHSVADPQPKFGLSVTGVVHPDRILDNARARPGDALILTKPLGTGVTVMAVKAAVASPAQEAEANRCMSALNGDASRIALACGATSCTDVTGFGLLGHALQMARASRVCMEICIDEVPKLDGALGFAAMGLLSAAAYSNRKYVGEAVEFDDGVELAGQDLLFDPQTSGGLLVACPQEKVSEMLARAREVLSTPCAAVGRVLEPGDNPTITVVGSTAEGDNCDAENG